MVGRVFFVCRGAGVLRHICLHGELALRCTAEHAVIRDRDLPLTKANARKIIAVVISCYMSNGNAYGRISLNLEHVLTM